MTEHNRVKRFSTGGLCAHHAMHNSRAIRLHIVYSQSQPWGCLSSVPVLLYFTICQKLNGFTNLLVWVTLANEIKGTFTKLLLTRISQPILIV